MQNLKRLLLNSLLLALVATAGWSIDMTAGNLEMTKDLAEGSGSPYVASPNGTDYSLAFAWGEAVAGDSSAGGIYQITSGYYGGRFGNASSFSLLSSVVGQPGVKTFFQDQLQVGVPFNAPVVLTFSDELGVMTLPGSIQAVIAVDHLGNSSNATAAVTLTPDTSSQTTVTVQPQTAWTGNTLYDIQITPKLQNLDGVPLSPLTHVYFLTRLDPQEDNIVINPLTAPGLPAAIGNGPIEAISIHFPTQSLSADYTVLSSRDPIHLPLNADPKIIQAANDKARAAGGPYQVPLALQEIIAYDPNGNLLGPLSTPAELTMNYGSAFAAPNAATGLIRPQTLSLYVLDQAHSLWVKIPESQNALGFQTVAAPVTQLSVFALMGSADASTLNTYVFPVPWRPHGPNSGINPGQTGTEKGGLTFSVLPSECTIKIYTIAGELVRQIQHSDIGATVQGQESWDGKTAHGENVASGVYLWRVESSVDGKNGKLMIIR